VANETTPRNIADFIPQRAVDHEVTEVGIVKLLVPRFRVPWMRWLQKRLVRSPFLKVSLDEVGSIAWLHMDGKTTVAQVGKVMEDNFGDRVRPVEERLGLFFGSLMRNKFDTWASQEVGNNDSPIEPK
jgi:hypothetical protein